MAVSLPGCSCCSRSVDRKCRMRLNPRAAVVAGGGGAVVVVVAAAVGADGGHFAHCLNDRYRFGCCWR